MIYIFSHPECPSPTTLHHFVHLKQSPRDGISVTHKSWNGVVGGGSLPSYMSCSLPHLEEPAAQLPCFFSRHVPSQQPHMLIIIL